MEDTLIKRIQLALEEKGFMPGPIDGIWGRRTIAAVKAFQKHKGLTVDGIVGPNTSAALLGESLTVATGPLIPWLAEAENLLGTKENLGKRNNPIILDWAADLDIHYPSDDIAWCGLFTAHCIGSTLPDEVLPINPLRALAWINFGESIEPRVGAIMTFWRKSPQSGFGHVGFYIAEDLDSYKILGGNQSDAVCYSWISKSRFVKARWPHTSASLGGGISVVKLNRRDDLSKNEA